VFSPSDEVFFLEAQVSVAVRLIHVKSPVICSGLVMERTIGMRIHHENSIKLIFKSGKADALK
jgi:hypothetical protein